MNTKVQNEVDHFLSTMISSGEYPSKNNLMFKYDQLFGSIDFRGKNVLEVGGGVGVFSFYAAFRGANWVVNLEPEGAGCKSFYIDKFKALKDALSINNVEIVESTFQDYNPSDKKFDIILLYNSINHLDEEACIHLRNDSGSWDIYKDIYKRMYQISNSHARIIIGDCSNKNFYALVGMKNPIYKEIEWHKHQSPDVWVKLLQECGFIHPAVTWTSFNRFGKVGKVILGNKYASYFLASHFILKMEKN
jgi:predicted RNA methylase